MKKLVIALVLSVTSGQFSSVWGGDKSDVSSKFFDFLTGNKTNGKAATCDDLLKGMLFTDDDILVNDILSALDGYNYKSLGGILDNNAKQWDDFRAYFANLAKDVLKNSKTFVPSKYSNDNSNDKMYNMVQDNNKKWVLKNQFLNDLQALSDDKKKCIIANIVYNKCNVKNDTNTKFTYVKKLVEGDGNKRACELP